MVVPLIPQLLQRRMTENTAGLLNTISLTWLGIYFILFPVVLFVALLRLAIPLSDQIWDA